MLGGDNKISPSGSWGRGGEGKSWGNRIRLIRPEGERGGGRGREGGGLIELHTDRLKGARPTKDLVEWDLGIK